MTSELGLFRALLYQLWKSHPRPWDWREGVASEVYRTISHVYPSFARPEELEEFLPSDGKLTDFALTKRFLYLEPCDGRPTFVPVLSVRCDSTLIQPEIRLQVGLFLRHGDDLRSIGLRFESPEGDAPGVHDYYHGQFITYFRNGPPLEGAPPWLPITQPALTLNSDGPVGLLLSLLVSLYGLDHVGRKILPALPGEIATYAKEFLPDHWLVHTRSGPLKYRTWKSADRFKARMEARHAGCTISPIESATYQTDDGRARHVD